MTDREKAIIESLLLSGITVEEIEKTNRFVLEEIKKIEEENLPQIMALQLYEMKEISQKTGAPMTRLYRNINQIVYMGRTIKEHREKKKIEIRERLTHGESPELIVKDRRLNVCMEAVDKIKNQMMRQEGEEVNRSNLNNVANNPIVSSEKKRGDLEPKVVSRKDMNAIIAYFVLGKSFREIRSMEEFSYISDEKIKQIMEQNMDRALALRLVPIKDIARKMKKSTATIYQKLDSFVIGEKTISKLRKEKIVEVEKRLMQGDTVENMANDENLNVDLDALISIEKKFKENSRLTRINMVRKRAVEDGPIQGEKISTRATPKEERVKRIEEKSKTKLEANTSSEDNQKERKSSNQTKIAMMRAKYMEQINRGKINGQTSIELSEDEKIIIDIALEKIHRILKEFDGRNYRKFITEIEKAIGVLANKHLAIEQIEKLIEEFESEKLVQTMQKMHEPEISFYVKSRKNKLYTLLARAIENEANNTTDERRLTELVRKIKPYMEERNFSIRIIKESVNRRIERVRIEKSNQSMRNISTDVKNIAKGIADGTLDVEKAKSILAKEAKSKAERRGTIVGYALTAKQEEKQLMYKIKKVLADEGEKYPILDVEATIKLLSELGESNITTNLNVVVRNQIARKKFDEAKQTCNQYEKANKGVPENLAYIQGLKKIINNSQIADIVYRSINANLSKDEEENIWKMLYKGIKLGKISINSIVIGRNENTGNNITLADIWPEDIRILDI